jgi:transposase InsO family protein
LARGHENLPSPSTVTAILTRHGRIDPSESAKHRAWQRFERQAPNELWQMDFKGHFPLREGRCHPLTVLDDHSRFSLGLEACGDERTQTVQQRLTKIFRHFGLPERMVMDNGAPWSRDADHRHTPVTVWLLRLGISVSHGRPYHPQTQGKDERFHRTLKAEVLRGATFRDMKHCQEAFDLWREIYNLERPHQALEMATPASRYHVSHRPFPEQVPPVEYGPEDQVRRVQDQGRFTWKGRNVKISTAFKGLPVAVRPANTDGLWDVFFMIHRICQIDLREPAEYV